MQILIDLVFMIAILAMIWSGGSLLVDLYKWIRRKHR